LQYTQLNSKITSDQDVNGRRLMSSNPGNEEKLFKIAPDTRRAFRVVIVDRDSMSGDLLAQALVRDKPCEAISIPPSELLGVLATQPIDLVVIAVEVNLKSGGGLDLTHAVSRAYPKICIVILLGESAHESVINAFRCGARGVFSRQRPMAEFLECVDHVRKGFIWAGKEETSFLLEALRSLAAPNVLTTDDSSSLTTRELQVVQCAAKGKTNKVIASDLGLSEHTVKNYLFRAFEKLGVSSRVELLFYLTLRGHTFGPTRADVEVEV
jgi:two-component system nitrate/nitrite response regulator NarL